LATVLGASLLLAGCTPAGRSDALSAAEGFQAAVDRRDWVSGCAGLSGPARQDVESTDTGCAAGLSELHLSGGTVGDVQVWGGTAQVRLGQQTLFLAEFSTGWKVTAAGCTYVSKDSPYDCEVKG
jgi:hypothetical protein